MDGTMMEAMPVVRIKCRYSSPYIHNDAIGVTSVVRRKVFGGFIYEVLCVYSGAAEKGYIPSARNFHTVCSYFFLLSSQHSIQRYFHAAQSNHVQKLLCWRLLCACQRHD